MYKKIINKLIIFLFLSPSSSLQVVEPLAFQTCITMRLSPANRTPFYAMVSGIAFPFPLLYSNDVHRPPSRVWKGEATINRFVLSDRTRHCRIRQGLSSELSGMAPKSVRWRQIFLIEHICLKFFNFLLINIYFYI